MHVQYGVRLITQTNNYDCWAAALGMVMNLGKPVMKSSGRISSSDLRRICRDRSLLYWWPRSWTVDELYSLLWYYGPLFVGGKHFSGLSHAMCLAGLSGDGSADGTYLHLLDPFPIGVGDDFTYSYTDALWEFPGLTNSIAACQGSKYARYG